MKAHKAFMNSTFSKSHSTLLSSFSDNLNSKPSKMGCVSSTFLSHDDDFSQMGGATTFHHHIVSLTSTTYGLLTLEPPSALHPSPTTAPTQPRFTLASLLHSPDPKELPEVINSWELMSGLDSTPAPSTPHQSFRYKENSNPILNLTPHSNYSNDVSPLLLSRKSGCVVKYPFDGFEKICPPNGQHRVVIYTTTLRGVRKTFEGCNAVRSAIEGFGVEICERDISMDRGFRDELKELLKSKESAEFIPPRVFIKGRYIGGVQEVISIFEDGELGELLQDLPRLKVGFVCDGCGGARFLPCFTCNGSCKVVVEMEDDNRNLDQGRTDVVRCSNCNENGLVQCPICC